MWMFLLLGWRGGGDISGDCHAASGDCHTTRGDIHGTRGDCHGVANIYFMPKQSQAAIFLDTIRSV